MTHIMKTVQYDRKLVILNLAYLTVFFSASDEEDWMNGYPISDKYKEAFENIASRWRATPLPAFDSSGKFIKVRDLEVSLTGSLILVYFELRHYAIRDRRTNGVSTNTFSATATQVTILESGAVRNPSPYKSLMLKGPKFLPQSPSKKKDQKNAVNAFHPGNETFALAPIPI